MSLGLTVEEYCELPASIRHELDGWLREIGVLDDDTTEWLVGITIGEGFVDRVGQNKRNGEQSQSRVFTKTMPPTVVMDLMVSRSMSGRAPVNHFRLQGHELKVRRKGPRR